MAVDNLSRVQGSQQGLAHRRLMAAVLMTVVDDCRGSKYRRARGCETPDDSRALRSAAAYMASRDRTWLFSFENLCEALDVNANRLRKSLESAPEVVAVSTA